MTTLSRGSTNPDTTYGTLDPTLWSNVEANTGIFCACLPTLRKLLVDCYKHCISLGGGGGGGGGTTSGGSSSSGAGAWRVMSGDLVSKWLRRGDGGGREERLVGGGDEGDGEGGAGVPMGVICKRTDVRVLRTEGEGDVEWGSVGKEREERFYRSVVHLP